jgi:hypothetical protein
MRLSRRFWLGLFVGLALAATSAVAAPPSAPPPALIEVESGGKWYEGKVVLNLEEQFWLMQTDGRMHELRVSKTSRFRQASPRFSASSPTVIAGELKKELGKGFGFATSRNYVVVASTDAKAKVFSNVLEDTFRAFRHYFSVRGLKLTDPEVPLVAIIFPTQKRFAEYGMTDRGPTGAGVRGYYSPMSNRVAMFEDEASIALTSSTPPIFAQDQTLNPFADLAVPRPYGKVTGDLKDTLVHEAVHQAAFNCGLHPRLGPTPRWVVEGLATVFEAPGIRNTSANMGEKSRINPERQIWFGNFVQTRRKERSLEAFLSTDKPFDTNTLDAYSEAWALSFYLVEKRPRDYAKFLAKMMTRSPVEKFTVTERLADFRETITSDITLLESDLLRFIKNLK